MGGLAIVLEFRDGWRRPLHLVLNAEVWRGTDLVGVLSGDTLRRMIAMHLASAMLHDQIGAELAAADGPAPASPPVPGRRPLASVPFTPTQRATWRAQRKSRRKP